MSVALVMRSPKFRILLYILGIGITCLTVLLLHNEHSHLKEVQRSYSICQQEKEICIQEKDSTSAQLQVLYEQKKRIETSLQQERTDHQKAKEGMEKKSIETQAAHSQLETEMNELHSKYSQLLNDYKLLKETNNQMENQLGELKESYALLEEEKKNLNIEVSSQLQALHQQREEEVNKLHDQLKKISGEKEQLLHDNAQQEWRLKQHDSKIRSCEKQHHQLMIQFDEVALQLNNCMKGINITKSENFHSQKSSNENRQNSITPKVDFGLHDHDTKEKSVHIPDTKVLHSTEVTEASKNVEKPIEDAVIGSEFNDTIILNTSSLYISSVSEDKQLDIPVTEATIRNSESGFSTLNSSLKETVSSDMTVTFQETTTPTVISHKTLETIISQEKKNEDENDVPLPLPDIVNNNKIFPENYQTNLSMGPDIINGYSTQSSKDKAGQPKLNSQFDEANIQNMDQEFEEKKRASDLHLEQLISQIKSGDVAQNNMENDQYPPLGIAKQEDENLRYQRYIPFRSDNEAKDENNYSQDRRIMDSGKDNDYAGYDRNIMNIPERQDYF